MPAMTEEKDPPRLVNWTGYLSLATLLLLPISVLTSRTGAWQPGLLLYAVAILGSGMLIVLSILQILLPRYAPWRTNISLNILLAFPGTLLLLSLLASGNSPRIHDVTTDVSDPPVFAKAPGLRGPDANTLDVKPDSIARQQEAYPDLQSLRSPLPADTAFDRSLDIAGQLGWEVYHRDRAAGVIEAVDTTRFMGFKDDVVIRIREDEHGTRVDLRSVSRVGQGDVGANAKRIRAFLKAFEARQ
jgi:uncharacterized protein (DUF1499 family)